MDTLLEPCGTCTEKGPSVIVHGPRNCRTTLLRKIKSDESFSEWLGGTVQVPPEAGKASMQLFRVGAPAEPSTRSSPGFCTWDRLSDQLKSKNKDNTFILAIMDTLQLRDVLWKQSCHELKNRQMRGKRQIYPYQLNCAILLTMRKAVRCLSCWSEIPNPETPTHPREGIASFGHRIDAGAISSAPLRRQKADGG